MTLSWYFFRQFFPSFMFGSCLFVFVLLLDRLFDLIDLIFNRGASIALVGKLYFLFLPTVLPLTLPMAILLASLVTFGRMSEENELTAVRAGGISLLKVLWMPVVFALALSLTLVPFNTTLAPYANNAFRAIYEQIIHADPLIKMEPRKFFAIKNIKLFADTIDADSKTMHHVFVYQMAADGRTSDRVFAQSGTITANEDSFEMTLLNGQLQRYDINDPKNLVHSSFGTYQITVPLGTQNKQLSTRFRNIPSTELKKLIGEMKSKGLPVSSLQAESSLRYAMAFAPFALLLVGMPLATVLKKGGRTFGFGITIMIIFVYYLLLIGGLTIAEKGILQADVALWIGNGTCLVASSYFIYRMLNQ